MPTSEEDKEYVEAELLPTLQKGLAALCRARPADPRTWLANYLLENKPPPPAVSITEAFKSAVLQVFALADEDGSGALDFQELYGIATSEAEAAAILDQLDTNKDGQISVEEWVSFFMELFARRSRVAEFLLERCVHLIFEREFMGICRALFEEFDKDSSGQLELQEILLAIGDDEQGAALLEYADTSGDKVLQLDEWMRFFLGFWRTNPQRARGNVGFLMRRAEELKMMPMLPPSMPVAVA